MRSNYQQLRNKCTEKNKGLIQNDTERNKLYIFFYS